MTKNIDNVFSEWDWTRLQMATTWSSGSQHLKTVGSVNFDCFCFFIMFVCLFICCIRLFVWKKAVGSANFDYSKKVSRFLNYSLAQWAPLITFWKSFISFSFCCTLIIYQVHCCQRANYTGGRYSLIVQTTGIWAGSSNFKSKSWNA